jgi:hypothetical protein
LIFTGSRALEPLRERASDAVPVTRSLLESYAPGRPVGNPPRPWLIVLPLALLAAGAVLWWFSGVSSGTAVRRWSAAFIALLVGSTAAKLVYATLYPWLPDGADGLTYAGTAEKIAQFGPFWHDPPVATLSHITSPLYPMILALLSPLNAQADGSVVGWKVAQVFVSLALVWLVWDLGRRMYGAPAGRAAALVATLSPLWLYSTELIQYELWLATFITASVWCLVRWNPAVGSGAGKWLLLAGLTGGLAALIQLKAAVLWAPVLVYLLRRTLAAHPGDAGGKGMATALRAFALAASVFLAAAIVPPGLWGVRNLAIQGEFILGSTGSGGLLWMGNQPGATGGYMQLPRPDAFYEYLKRYPEGSDRSRESRVYTDLAIDAIKRSPARFLDVSLVKLERFWWTITPERLGEFSESRMTAFLGGLVEDAGQVLFSKAFNLFTLTVLCAGTLLGHRLSDKTGAASSWRMLVIGSIAVFWLSHAPFIAEPRYRIPIAPLLHVLQGAGLVLLGQRLRDILARLRRTYTWPAYEDHQHRVPARL